MFEQGKLDLGRAFKNNLFYILSENSEKSLYTGSNTENQYWMLVIYWPLGSAALKTETSACA